jgi:hypothetical protein
MRLWERRNDRGVRRGGVLDSRRWRNGRGRAAFRPLPSSVPGVRREREEQAETQVVASRLCDHRLDDLCASATSSFGDPEALRLIVTVVPGCLPSTSPTGRVSPLEFRGQPPIGPLRPATVAAVPARCGMRCPGLASNVIVSSPEPGLYALCVETMFALNRGSCRVSHEYSPAGLRETDGHPLTFVAGCSR